MLEQRVSNIATALFLVMIVAAIRVLVEIPLATPLAIHFDAAGNPNGWAPAWIALSIVPLLSLGVLVLFALLPKIDPRGANLLRSKPAVQTILLAGLGLLAAIQLMLAVQALGIPMSVPRIVATLVGLLFLLTGNVMGKLRWNYTVGIRTPWTLASERVWDQTHRFAGRLFVAVGAFVAIGVWWNSMRGHEAAAVMTGTTLAAILPVVRSYLLWRKQR